jgi:predicted acylesterase/phospholipase RssA
MTEIRPADQDGPRQANLYLTLTLPGAVSLGAYEGGALAALLVAVQNLQGAIVIDSIASASAGSVTALVAARALTRGADPVELMRQAWVDLDGLKAMRTHDVDGPLSSEALLDMAARVFGSQDPAQVDGAPTLPKQDHPVTLSMALASLSGLNYNLASLEDHTSVQAATYLDWYRAEITEATTDEEYLAHAQGAVASGSNAAGFPPFLLDRSSFEAEYAKAGLTNFPASKKIWYTDGGTVDNEPLGRAIDIAPAIERGPVRLFLLVHPDPAAPLRSGPFQEPEPQPSWLRSALRAFSVARSQSIYDDLKRMVKTNSFLIWTERAVNAVQEGLDAAPLSSGDKDTVRISVATAISNALGELQADKDWIHNPTAPPRSPNGGTRSVPQVSAGDLGPLLADLIKQSAGLADKSPTRVEVVSPLIDDTEGLGPAALLAGAFLFHFGGFLDVKFRQSDFALGYRNMSYWLKTCLKSYLPGADLTPAIEAVGQRYAQLGWDDLHQGGAGLHSLSLEQKFELLGLAGHIGHVLENDLRHWDDT